MTPVAMDEQKQAAMAFLRAKFLGALVMRVKDMRSVIDALAVAPENGNTEQALTRLFHSLAGIGGTYGFHEITFLAKAGEDACALGGRRNAAARTALLHAIVNAIEVAGVSASERQ